jgi:tight adherence protein B
MLTIIIFLTFATAVIVAYSVIPYFYQRLTVLGEKRRQKLSGRMESLFPAHEARKRGSLFVFMPLILSMTLYIIFPEGFKVFGLVMGATSGFLLPGLYVRFLKKRLKDRFSDQLVDALMIMSSSFRGGLSLVQAMEAVVEEMPNPINAEFSTVLSENKMGVSLGDALEHLYNRMPSPALQQMITAILLARETGGNLPVIFSRIVTNIRESKKIQQNIDTLTVQGKLQGVVMALLPIAFAFIIYSANRRMFDNMINSPVGRGMLMYALVSEIIGAFLIVKISTFKDF